MFNTTAKKEVEFCQDIIPGRFFFDDNMINCQTAGKVLEAYETGKEIDTYDNEELVVSNYKIWVGDCR